MQLARLAFLFLLSTLIGGCLVWTADDDDSAVVGDDDDAVDDDDTTEPLDDLDNDGVTEADGDCDDADPTVYPGADELCNEVDDDCDGDVDEGVTLLTFRPDADGDGFPTRNAGAEVQGCFPPEGYIEAVAPYDCADSLASVYPGATETCNGVDDNCDGSLDEGVKVDLYVDGDLDGYGAGGTVGLGCPGDGYSELNDDCDDSDPQASPADQDGDGFSGCDGDCDDQNSNIVPGQDGDGDGQVACSQDCDDEDNGVYLGAPEACNQRDDDCDGVIDDGLKPALVIRGAGAAGGTQVRNVLNSGGYCVAPVMDVTSVTSAQLSWFKLIVVTADTGDTSGWYGDPYPVFDWYWSWTGGSGGETAPALIGMGAGGMALMEWVGVSGDYAVSQLTSASGGVVQAQDASAPLWSTPNQVLNTSSTVTVHTQSFASTSPLTLTGTGGNIEVLGWTPGGEAILTRTPTWTGQPLAYYWGFDQGLNLATAAGQQLFQNLVRSAIGPP